MKIFLFLVATMLMFTSCQSIDNYIDKNISEIRESLYEGSCDDFNVTLVCGEREKDYVLNGISTSNIEFGVLTFDIKNMEISEKNELKYVLNIGTERYSGELEINPFDNTLVADIHKKVTGNENIRAKVILDDFVKEVKLEKVDCDFSINSSDVKKIISKNFKDDIKLLIEEGEFKGEIYIKILNDADMYIGDYYWYVSIISRDGRKLNTLISTKTGEILSINGTLGKV